MTYKIIIKTHASHRCWRSGLSAPLPPGTTPTQVLVIGTHHAEARLKGSSSHSVSYANRCDMLTEAALALHVHQRHLCTTKCGTPVLAHWNVMAHVCLQPWSHYSPAYWLDLQELLKHLWNE